MEKTKKQRKTKQEVQKMEEKTRFKKQGRN